MSQISQFLEDAKITQASFAGLIGKKQSYVSMLLHRIEKGRPVPADICPAIEKATGGKISRHDMRPDLWPKRGRAA